MAWWCSEETIVKIFMNLTLSCKSANSATKVHLNCQQWLWNKSCPAKNNTPCNVLEISASAFSMAWAFVHFCGFPMQCKVVSVQFFDQWRHHRNLAEFDCNQSNEPIIWSVWSWCHTNLPCRTCSNNCQKANKEMFWKFLCCDQNFQNGSWTN